MRWFLTLLWAFPVMAQLSLHNPGFVASLNTPAAGGGGSGDVFTETFEGSNSGYDLTGWSALSGGAGIDPDYTGTVLEGSQSLRLNSATGDQSPYRSISVNSVYGYFQLRILSSAGGPSVMSLVVAYNGPPLFRINVESDGRLTVHHGSQTATTTGTISAGTTYNLWFFYDKGTGTDGQASIAFSSTSTRPTGGANFASLANGDANSGLGAFSLWTDDAGVPLDAVFDTVKLSSTSANW